MLLNSCLWIKSNENQRHCVLVCVVDELDPGFVKKKKVNSKDSLYKAFFSELTATLLNASSGKKFKIKVKEKKRIEEGKTKGENCIKK